jgi:hypothetical protein
MKTGPQTVWNGSKLTVTSTLLPRAMWFTASIDVFLDGNCVLRTGGRLETTGTQTAQFVHSGKNHEVSLTWGRPSLTSFPIEIHMDGQSVLRSRVFTGNWYLSLWPFALIAAYTLYAILQR